MRERQAIRAVIRERFPCRSSKHDGVHSDMACWQCSGRLVSKEGMELIDALEATLSPADTTPPAEAHVVGSGVQEAGLRTLIAGLVSDAFMDDEKSWFTCTATADRILELLRTAPAETREPETREVARPLDEWHDDDGPALWWVFHPHHGEVYEPPYSGTPLDSDWPGYHTHWTPITVPAAPHTPETPA